MSTQQDNSEIQDEENVVCQICKDDSVLGILRVYLCIKCWKKVGEILIPLVMKD